MILRNLIFIVIFTFVFTLFGSEENKCEHFIASQTSSFENPERHEIADSHKPHSFDEVVLYIRSVIENRLQGPTHEKTRNELLSWLDSGVDKIQQHNVEFISRKKIWFFQQLTEPILARNKWNISGLNKAKVYWPSKKAELSKLVMATLYLIALSHSPPLSIWKTLKTTTSFFKGDPHFLKFIDLAFLMIAKGKNWSSLYSGNLSYNGHTKHTIRASYIKEFYTGVLDAIFPHRRWRLNRFNSYLLAQNIKYLFVLHVIAKETDSKKPSFLKLTNVRNIVRTLYFFPIKSIEFYGLSEVFLIIPGLVFSLFQIVDHHDDSRIIWEEQQNSYYQEFDSEHLDEAEKIVVSPVSKLFETLTEDQSDGKDLTEIRNLIDAIEDELAKEPK